MAKNYKSASYLNARIENIIKNGYRPITDFSYTKQNYNWILKPHGRKNSHLIMTYEEAKKEMSKVIPDNPLTIEEYTRELHRLQDTYEDRFTLPGEKRYQRSYMESVAQEALDTESERDIDVKKLSTERLRSAFKYAREMSTSNPIKSKDGSPRFYEYLSDYLNNAPI